MNRWTGLGRLGKDPELKYTQTGTPVCEFTIAVDESYKKDGQKVQKTEWVRIITWKALAEICGKYLAKGKLVLIEGKLEEQKWEKDGVKHSVTKVIASSMTMLDGKKDAGDNKESGAAEGTQESFSNAPPEDVPY